jgi:hypothetical protein
MSKPPSVGYRFQVVLSEPWVCPEGCAHAKGDIVDAGLSVSAGHDLKRRCDIAEARIRRRVKQWQAFGVPVELSVAVFACQLGRGRAALRAH